MKKRIGLLAALAVVIVLAGICAFSYRYYTKYVNITTIYPGVKIAGMDAGGMTNQEAQEKIDAYLEELSAKTVTLQVGEKEKQFPLSKLGLSCDSESAAEEAMQLGKTGGLLKRVLQISQLSKEGTEIPLHFTVDKKKTKKVLKNKGKKFVVSKKDASIKRNGDVFEIQPEQDGISIDFAANAEKLAAMIEDDAWNQQDILFPMDYEKEQAEHTKEELSEIQDVLGSFTTSYAGSTSGRCANVENGAKLIDGSLLYPGESFSVYEKVSPFDPENGYELAGSYENGKTVQTYGGGICQVSTTLYNAVLRAELSVTERANHSMTVHYVELSEDAAISGTEKDLKFENNLKTPIYIEGKTSGNQITFTIYGKEYRDASRTIEFVSETVSSTAPSEKTVKDKTMEEGKRVVEEQGRTGYKARLWKVVYEDGEEVERTQINSSSYQATQSVVRVGTKKKTTTKKEKKTAKKSTKKSKKKTTASKTNNSSKKKKSSNS